MPVQGGGMSRVRLVVNAVVVEGRTHAEVAARYGLSRSWVTKLVAQYRVEGESAFESRSRRPRTSSGAVYAEVTELIVGLRADLDMGATQHGACIACEISGLL